MCLNTGTPKNINFLFETNGKLMALGVPILKHFRVFRFSKIARITVKILKIGTPEIITIIVLQLEQLDFTVQYCVQKMQTE